MSRLSIPVIAGVCGGLALLAGGLEPFGRLALRAGQPALAGMLVSDPALRGIALSAQGRQVDAIAAFERAGPAQTYNRATAHALNGDFAEALLSYDDLLSRDPDHRDARTNFRIVASLYGGTKLDLAFMDLLTEEKEGPTIEAPDAQGGGRAIGDGAESDGMATDIFAPKIKTDSGLRRVPRIFDDMYIEADRNWLTTMLDQPGKFLTARLKAEQKRRQELGIGVEGEEGAW